MRNLVFTDAQVYFQCAGMFCMEMVNLPVESEIPSEWKVFPARMRLKGQQPSIQSVLNKRICEYRLRELTWKKDRYQAFQGVLSGFRQIGLENLYGIPLYIVSDHNITKSQCLQFHLCWTNPQPSIRNEYHPS